MNLKQLAAHLKLSQTTVSRALNGYPEVGEETRRRVAEAARQFNYRPNPNATRLATGKSHAIGYVFPTDGSLELDPVFSVVLSGASEVYGAKGFDIILKLAGPEDEAAVYSRFAQSGVVDGFVLSAPGFDDWRLDHLIRLKVPFIVHGRVGYRENDYAWLDIDNHGAFRQATKLLTDFGHSRIALMNGIEISNFAAMRRAGYEEAMSARGLPLIPHLMSSDPMTEEVGYRRLRGYLESETPPTAVLCSNMLMASGAMRAIHQAGLQIGTDISLIVHDDGLPFLNAESLTPPLTTTRSSIRQAGHRLAELLLGMIADRDAPLPHELWSVDLVVRGSTGPAPRR